MTKITIGVLALQGAFIEHQQFVESLGCNSKQVKLIGDLDGIDGLILPGGESTAIINIAERWNLVTALKEYIKSGRPVWGTCAGIILLADRIKNGKIGGQTTLGGLNVEVTRNWFGSQIESTEMLLNAPIIEEKHENIGYDGVFIRAPAITDVGDGVDIISTVNAKYQGKGNIVEVAVAVKQGNILATSFHPELTNDKRWHQYFINNVKSYKKN